MQSRKIAITLQSLIDNLLKENEEIFNCGSDGGSFNECIRAESSRGRADSGAILRVPACGTPRDPSGTGDLIPGIFRKKTELRGWSKKGGTRKWLLSQWIKVQLFF